MSIKKILEEINKFAEEDVNEQTLQDEITPDEPATVIEPEFNDTMSLADQFDAKARIARALEALQAAVEEFKAATAEKVDLLQDQALMQGIAGLDEQVAGLETALASGSKILGDTSLNDPFKPELPDDQTEMEDEETGDLDQEEEESEEDSEEEEEDYDFDTEAGLDLLAPEE